jgi:2-polyprenyl-3-methyl-5-hydroxy-6-metoxy-1,4-benzoquinol methylase
MSDNRISLVNQSSIEIHTTVGQDEKIEILSIELLDHNQDLVDCLKRLASSLHLEFGWHYLLDLTWIIKNLGPVMNKQIMDAGAGVGVIQWYLARQGANVISVDRQSRADLDMNFRSRFRVRGLRETDLIPRGSLLLKDLSRKINHPFIWRWSAKVMTIIRHLLQMIQKPGGLGNITIYNQDLAEMVDIPTDSLDAVVAVSALEHNTMQGLEQVIKEIMRVLKPGGRLLATLAASENQDWWHEPSHGWCLTEASLRQLFDMHQSTPSNYEKYGDLFDGLYHCGELRGNLASFYYRSGQNGMPWGKWDPKYQPVGICKIKRD